MSEVQHTPEPWKVSKGDVFGKTVVCEGQDGWGEQVVAKCWVLPWDQRQTEANARRIVAAVNALQGVKTEDLEEAIKLGINDVSMGNLFSSRLKLTRERDEARAMVKELAKQLKKEHKEALDLWMQKYKHIDAVHNPACCHSCDLIAKAEAIS